MTACSKHPGTQSGARLRELLAECERLLKQIDQLDVEELDQYELLDALAKEIDDETVTAASQMLCDLRLQLPRQESNS